MNDINKIEILNKVDQLILIQVNLMDIIKWSGLKKIEDYLKESCQEKSKEKILNRLQLENIEIECVSYNMMYILYQGDYQPKTIIKVWGDEYLLFYEFSLENIIIEQTNKDEIKKISSNLDLICFSFHNRIYMHVKETIFYITPLFLFDYYIDNYGEFEVNSLKFIDTSSYEFNISCSKRTTYLVDTDTNISGVFNLNKFLFESLNISRENINLK